MRLQCFERRQPEVHFISVGLNDFPQRGQRWVMGSTMSNSKPHEKKMKHPPRTKRNGKDDPCYPEGFSEAPLLDHHEELGDAGDKEGEGHQADQDLMRIELALFGQREEACGSVVPPEEPDDKGLRGFDG
jgi:hypothetical protein